MKKLIDKYRSLHVDTLAIKHLLMSQPREKRSPTDLATVRAQLTAYSQFIDDLEELEWNKK